MKLEDLKIEEWSNYGRKYTESTPGLLLNAILRPSPPDPYDGRKGALESLEEEVEVLRDCVAKLMEMLLESDRLDLAKVLELNSGAHFKVNGERI